MNASTSYVHTTHSTHTMSTQKITISSRAGFDDDDASESIDDPLDSTDEMPPPPPKRRMPKCHFIVGNQEPVDALPYDIVVAIDAELRVRNIDVYPNNRMLFGFYRSPRVCTCAFCVAHGETDTEVRSVCAAIDDAWLTHEWICDVLISLKVTQNRPLVKMVHGYRDCIKTLAKSGFHLWFEVGTNDPTVASLCGGPISPLFTTACVPFYATLVGFSIGSRPGEPIDRRKAFDVRDRTIDHSLRINQFANEDATPGCEIRVYMHALFVLPDLMPLALNWSWRKISPIHAMFIGPMASSRLQLAEITNVLVPFTFRYQVWHDTYHDATGALMWFPGAAKRWPAHCYSIRLIALYMYHVLPVAKCLCRILLHFDGFRQWGVLPVLRCIESVYRSLARVQMQRREQQKARRVLCVND